MDTNGLLNLVITALVLVWLLSRQLTARPLKEKSRLAFVLIVVGAIETVSFVPHHSLTGGDLGLLVLSLAIGVALAVVRAFTVRLWQQDGQLYRKGNALTAVLWIVSIGLHLLIDTLIHSGLGSVTVLLYFGIVLAVQRQVLLGRARTAALTG